MKTSCLILRGLTAVAAFTFLLPALGQQEEAPSIEEQPESAAETASSSAITTAQQNAEPELPPVADLPRFVSEIVGNVDDVNGDLFWWGQSVNLAGSMLSDVFAGGSSVSLDGYVGNNAFVGGSTVNVTGEVQGNLYIATAQAFIQEGALIHGHVLCFCGSLTINGTVRGTVQGSGGQTILSGEVGALKLEVGTITLMPDAVVHGDFDYEGNDEADIADGAEIGGQIRWNPVDDDDDEEEEVEPASGGIGVWDVLSEVWWYLANLVVGVAFLVFGGRLARAPVERLRDQAAVGLGFGFVVAVVVPVACLIALLLLVTLPLGFIVMMIYTVAVFLARLVTAQYLGDWILRRAGQEQPSEFLALAGGLVVFLVATEIPYVGFLIWLTALFLGFGGLFLAFRPQRPSTTQSI
ncbi:MAG: hypothetical protein GKS06_12915 [Acidobacteria bacterium]|nr:hypothetical protein [Acidobacteriota bacterium]